MSSATGSVRCAPGKTRMVVARRLLAALMRLVVVAVGVGAVMLVVLGQRNTGFSELWQMLGGLAILIAMLGIYNWRNR